MTNSIIKVYNLSLSEAINTRGADVAKDAALKESNQLIEKACQMPVDKLTVQKLKEGKQLIIPSKLFLKDKYRPDGTFDKFKARLGAGGHRQNHDDYESTSSPTVATSSVLIVAAMSAKRGKTYPVLIQMRICVMTCPWSKRDSIRRSPDLSSAITKIGDDIS